MPPGGEPERAYIILISLVISHFIFYFYGVGGLGGSHLTSPLILITSWIMPKRGSSSDKGQVETNGLDHELYRVYINKGICLEASCYCRAR